MKKLSPPLQNQDQSPTFLDTESRVFSVQNGKIYVGKEQVNEVLLSLLRDEAMNLKTTRLWEILNASILNEAYHLALIQSNDFEQVQFAKALKHWSFFMENVLHTLTKEK